LNVNIVELFKVLGQVVSTQVTWDHRGTPLSMIGPLHITEEGVNWRRLGLLAAWKKEIWHPSILNCNTLNYLVFGVCESHV
jgi:hypothetical protein